MADSAKKIKLLIKFGALIAKEPRLDKLLALIAEQVSKILNCDRCGVFLIDKKAKQLWSKVTIGIRDIEIRLPMGKGIMGIAALKGKSINVKNAYKDKRFTVDIDKVLGYKTVSYLVVPLKNSKGDILGVFQVSNKLNTKHFTKEDEGVLSLLGTVASNAIENAKLYENVRNAQMETIYRLAITAEYRDQHDTARHLRTISNLSYMLALAVGCSKEFAENLRRASPLHDIGKVGLADSILLKPGKLTRREYEIMKDHTIYAAKILTNAQSDLLKLAYSIALNHHERYDGSGYPNKLRGKKIPVEARILAVVDVFDALCMARVYKPAWGTKKSYDYIVSQSGKLFDPKIVAAFKKIFPQIEELYNQNNSFKQ
jgi:response regulator RpfG family c-di-GMP phosphodiesterase